MQLQINMTMLYMESQYRTWQISSDSTDTCATRHIGFAFAERCRRGKRAPHATSALCIASHRKAMSHSRSDAEGAGEQSPV